MPRSKRIVPIPQPDAGSFNKDRPLIKNTLLLNQVKHFQEVERTLMTEGQASEYIQRITGLLHPRTETAGGKRTE
jgi:hypothetical protein